jgi:aminopeptidase-like protein
VQALASLNGFVGDARIGDEIFALAAEIYPICRSITGDGVRSTLDHLARHSWRI